MVLLRLEPVWTGLVAGVGEGGTGEGVAVTWATTVGEGISVKVAVG